MTTSTLNLTKRLSYFVLIGGTAALTHILVVGLLVRSHLAQPLIANIFAFFIAFNISFLGHRYVTFSRLQDQKLLSLPHFFIVAASGGLFNELFYFLLLRFTHLNYLIALILVLGLIAVYNYILARYWACR